MSIAKLEHVRLGEIAPFTPWGRIDWENVSHKVEIESWTELVEHLHAAGISDHRVTLLWSSAAPGELPAIRTKLNHALDVMDDVTCVGHDTYMLSLSGQFVIEIFHDGIVRMAFLHAPGKQTY